ncbi:MAG: hypothetical protein ACI9IP_000687 [Arcticibacterium sp.]|jgi:hypothetical protein
MTILLKLKHWQLFILLFFPMVFSTDSILGHLVHILAFSLYLMWIYTIATTAFNQLKEAYEVRIKYFNFSILFVVCWLLVATLFAQGGYQISQNNYQEFGSSLWIIASIYLYGVWSIIFIFYFAAKMLVSKNEGKIIGLDRAFNCFMGFWIFPIGIWFIQPMAQQLLEDDNKKTKDE